MTGRPTLLDWLGFAVLVLLWGSAFAVVKVSLQSVGPLWLATIRLAVASVVILVVVGRHMPRLPRPHEYGGLILLGFFNNTLPMALVGWASLSVPSAVVGLIMAASPIVLMLFSLVLLREERPSPIRVAGVLLGFAGVGMVMLGRGGGAGGGGDAGLLPYFALLAGAASFALTTIMGRRLTGVPLWTRTAGVMLGSLLAALLIALAFEPLPRTMTPASFLATMYLGAVPSAVGGLILYWLLERTSAAFTVQTNYLLPVVAMLTGVVVLGEHVTALQWAGMVVILGGMALAEQIWRRRST